MIVAGFGLIACLGMACIAAWKPRLLVYLLWPVIMVYPHRLTYGMLPLNAGFDDLLILCTAVAWFIFGKPNRIGFAGTLLLVFLVIYGCGELTGLLSSGGEMLDSTVRNMLKMTVKVVFGLTVVSAISQPEHAKWMFFFYAAALTTAAVLAMADWAKLPFADWFYVVKSEEQQLLRYRATGPFLGPGSAGTNLALATIMVGYLVVHRFKISTRVVAFSACVVLFGTMIAAGSRSAFVGLVVVAMGILIFSRHRIAVAACMSLAVATFATLPSYRSAVEDMVSRTEAQASAEEGALHGTGRLDNIGNSIRWSGGIATLFFGVGETQFAARGAYAHNGFISFLLCFGLCGFTWLVIWCFRLWKDSRLLLRIDTSSFATAIATATPWWLVCSIVSNMTFDCTLNVFWQYQLIWLGAIVQQLAKIAEATWQDQPSTSFPIQTYSNSQQVSCAFSSL
ncbi:hypothetical protein Q31b_27340 [Novipirellula aureliae]|uniref:O-Antigen ligase n=2 Tax=Novipirellula aureliae TaxID=2527966 RepID=A0A5C6DY02_9BACT|nr:hypothetical protein Q31b_27340 [Novipirellula aureliae]